MLVMIIVVIISDLRDKGVLGASIRPPGCARRGREVERIGGPCDIGRAFLVQRDANSEVIGAAAEIGGVDDRRAVAVQLRHECVVAASDRRLEGARRGREVGRIGLPRHINIAFLAYRDAIGAIVKVSTAAAEIRGVDERRAAAAQLRHECVKAASDRRLEGAGRGREVGRR
jgi:hypothetical protein